MSRQSNEREESNEWEEWNDWNGTNREDSFSSQPEALSREHTGVSEAGTKHSVSESTPWSHQPVHLYCQDNVV